MAIAAAPTAIQGQGEGRRPAPNAASVSGCRRIAAIGDQRGRAIEIADQRGQFFQACEQRVGAGQAPREGPKAECISFPFDQRPCQRPHIDRSDRGCDPHLRKPAWIFAAAAIAAAFPLGTARSLKSWASKRASEIFRAAGPGSARRSRARPGRRRLGFAFRAQSPRGNALPRPSDNPGSETLRAYRPAGCGRVDPAHDAEIDRDQRAVFGDEDVPGCMSAWRSRVAEHLAEERRGACHDFLRVVPPLRSVFRARRPECRRCAGCTKCAWPCASNRRAARNSSSPLKFPACSAARGFKPQIHFQAARFPGQRFDDRLRLQAAQGRHETLDQACDPGEQIDVARERGLHAGAQDLTARRRLPASV